MKIAIITPFFYPHIGGMERSLFNLSKGLQKTGNDVIIFTTNYGGTASDLDFRIIRNKSNELFDWANNIKYFIQSYGPFEAIIYGGIGRDVFDGILESLKEFKDSTTKSFLRIPTSDHVNRHLRDTNARDILSRFNHIVCIDKIAMDELKETYGLTSIHYIPHGVDINLYAPVIPFSKRASTILYSGRIAKRKNIEVVLSLARNFNMKYNFLIQGSPSYGEIDYYNSIINSFKSLENVSLIDPSWDNHKVYKQAGIFILPSDVEGCANSLLEAMSSELYCFASNIVENETIISKYGTLFNLGSKTIEEHLNNFQEKLDKNTLLIKTGREHIIKHFSIDRTVEKWMKILNDNI